ncbi:hypothetical protein ACFYZ8_00820 [Streptomyces sp. NPDC001668]|uniref:hypothetical protein n=1 Tax=unclassified Streptomyces TaxID=2593676 RepID=UPI0033FB88A2
MRALSDVTLAAVWTPDPDHPYTWTKFLGFWCLVAGVGIAVLGLTLSVVLVRGVEDRKWGGYVIGPVILALGLAIGYVGIRLV